MTGSVQSGLVLAHGGGLPEAAMLGVPVLALVLLAALERRARRRKRTDDEPEQ